MAAKFKLEVVTPDGVAYCDDVDMVTIPGSQGEMGVYPNHVPLMTQIVAGELIARKDNHDTLLVVGDGFAEITGDHVSILTDMAINAETVDDAKIEEARLRAEARLREKLSAEQIAAANAALTNALAILRTRKRR